MKRIDYLHNLIKNMLYSFILDWYWINILSRNSNILVDHDNLAVRFKDDKHMIAYGLLVMYSLPPNHPQLIFDLSFP